MKNNNSYNELKKITDGYYSGKINKWSPLVFKLFKKYHIGLRQNDGELKQMNISIPKSKSDSIVVGLRYLKRDNTFTEDLFLFQKGKKLEKHYRGSLEKILPEYKGSHKLQIDL